MCVIQLDRDVRIYNIVVLLVLCFAKSIRYRQPGPRPDIVKSSRHRGASGMIRFENQCKNKINTNRTVPLNWRYAFIICI